MGCCLSTSSPSSPYTAGPAHSSSRAINSSQPQSQAALPRPSTHASNQTDGPPTDHAHALSRHINRPLRPHVWKSKGRSWTGPELEREREDFFHTRVTGRPEIWQTLRVALDILWTGGDDMDNDGGIATAQQILTAAEITVPSGDLADGAYDSFGAFYPLPEHIVSDPANIVQAVTLEAAGKGEESENTKEVTIVEGNKVARPEEKISVKARRSDGVVKDLVIKASKKDSIQFLSVKFMEAAKLQPPKRLKLAYMGRLLRPSESLETEGWEEGHVLNALIFD
ncbi:hypothetical protein OIDMADRAFT_28138 [Oidiodendron maius Zn]|uniref:Ubiquitin-like domain-containing protein n=1 Tax=Oidiodendron maius (strain Zn) TaxID=913774 RepID=A0A0C3HI44_OIDMZ|nr:hypothetical protein OIDMADRAFT_28138 [Oidiodendron maius Zn]